MFYPSSKNVDRGLGTAWPARPDAMGPGKIVCQAYLKIGGCWIDASGPIGFGIASVGRILK